MCPLAGRVQPNYVMNAVFLHYIILRKSFCQFYADIYKSNQICDKCQNVNICFGLSDVFPEASAEITLIKGRPPNRTAVPMVDLLFFTVQMLLKATSY